MVASLKIGSGGEVGEVEAPGNGGPGRPPSWPRAASRVAARRRIATGSSTTCPRATPGPATIIGTSIVAPYRKIP
jgi:hypothetical protein